MNIKLPRNAAFDLCYEQKKIRKKPYFKHINMFALSKWFILADRFGLYQIKRKPLTLCEIQDFRKSCRAYKRTVKHIRLFFEILSDNNKNDYAKYQNICRYIPYFLYGEMVSGTYSYYIIKKVLEKNDLNELDKMAKKGEEIYLKLPRPWEYFSGIRSILNRAGIASRRKIVQDEIIGPKDVDLLCYILKEEQQLIPQIPKDKRDDFTALLTMGVLEGNISQDEIPQRFKY